MELNQWHIQRDHSMSTYLARKKSAMAIVKNRKTWFGPFVKALVARQEMAPLYEILNKSLNYVILSYHT